jgi:hypothetical protein
VPASSLDSNRSKPASSRRFWGDAHTPTARGADRRAASGRVRPVRGCARRSARPERPVAGTGRRSAQKSSCSCSWNTWRSPSPKKVESLNV